ncbi:RDD family protein [Halopseudomonas phragmitis]|uniref:RDD domain-containing protein n=2 Tax=Pseudomonadaceae TaxID=135621 RepID=A0A1V0B0M0_9GAMM|nr:MULTISPECIES: RDD family protein [Pseudomonadaceae]AQZ93479.1 hypothetical protein BVH74_01275 [Halopseudomonas phragmitis]RHW19614.1 RDD family protein [Pseudomonas jilinensis]
MAVKLLNPEGDFPAAGLLRRLAGMFYDFLLCVALVMVLTLGYQQGLLRALYGADTLLAMSEAGQLDRDPLLGVLLLLSLLTFFIGFWSWKGQTLGMQAWRVRLQQPDGRSITLRQGLIRFFVGLASWLCGGLGHLWMLWDKQSRSWQDIASGTQLVRLPKR